MLRYSSPQVLAAGLRRVSLTRPPQALYRLLAQVPHQRRGGLSRLRLWQRLALAHRPALVRLRRRLRGHQAARARPLVLALKLQLASLQVLGPDQRQRPARVPALPRLQVLDLVLQAELVSRLPQVLLHRRALDRHLRLGLAQSLQRGCRQAAVLLARLGSKRRRAPLVQTGQALQLV